MMKTSTTCISGTLVIGYGSTLRSDDAAGFVVARALEEMKLPGVQCCPTHQLTPDLAERMSMVSDVFFIDAYSAADCGAAIHETLLDDELNGTEYPVNISTNSHACVPKTLLALTQMLYGRRPRARLITIPALDFSLGDQLSSTTQAGIEAAKEIILKRIACHA